MLHVIVWLFVALTFAAALVFEGAGAFSIEDHWLQRVQAGLLVASAVAVLRLDRVHPAARVLLSTGAVWLALDETLMFHECLKPLFWRALPGFGGRDPVVVLYGAAGAVGLALLAHGIVWSPRTIGHVVAAAAGALAVVLVDAAHVLGGNLGTVVEETGELIAGAGALGVLLAQPAPSPTARNMAGVLVFVAATIAWIATATSLLRPYVCPLRLW